MRLLIVLLFLLCPLPSFAQPSAPASGPAAVADSGTSALDSAAIVVAPDASAAAPAPGSLVEIPAVVVSGPASAIVDIVVPASVPAAAPASLPGDDDVFGHGKEAFEAVKAARRAPTLAGVAAAIVAGIMLLISVARRFGGMLLTSNQVRLFVVIASALAGGVAQVSDGMGWTEVLFVALTPVVSVGMHQVFVKPVTRKGGRPTADRP